MLLSVRICTNKFSNNGLELYGTFWKIIWAAGKLYSRNVVICFSYTRISKQKMSKVHSLFSQALMIEK